MKGGKRENAGRKPIYGKQIKLKLSYNIIEYINNNFEGSTQNDRIRECIKVGIYNEKK